MINFRKKLDSLEKIELLALLSAASVLRKRKYFSIILNYLVEKKIPCIKIYESLLQTYLFAGFPSALISLKEFAELTGYKKNYIGYDLSNYQRRGNINCKMIYGDKYEKLISNVNSFSPELSNWLIIEGYGKVLGRNPLTLKERELCIISMLASLNYKDQLYSHINGAFKLKVPIKKIEAVIKNLEIIDFKTGSKFGQKVIHAFKLHKGILAL